MLTETWKFVRQGLFVVLLAALSLLLPAGVAIPAEKNVETGKPVRTLAAEDLKHLPWRSVGPPNMGGRVSAIGLVPGSRTSFYVGFATGGLFKTTNMGVTFAPVFDDQKVLSIGSVEVADATAAWNGWDDQVASEDRKEKGKGKIVWVGTGEGNGRNSSSWGNGVYRSTDGGGSFEHLGLEATHDIPRIAVDPRDPDVCYVAALGHLWGANPERGVFKTSDGGKSWSHVLKVDENIGASDVVIDPNNPDTVYAALYARRRMVWGFTGNSDKGGIFRSDNGGKTWKKLVHGLPPVTGRIGLTVLPQDTNKLLAVVESNWGGSGRTPWENRSPTGGLFRTTDRGETWERLTDLSFRPFYFSRVAVDPEDENRIYLPGWDLAISDDGGKSFRRSGSERVHVDFHAIVVNPIDSNQILIGNDGGVYISHDRAKTWDYLRHMAVGQFYEISVDMSDPYRIAGGMQDNGSWIGPSETLHFTEDTGKDGILAKDWEMIGGGDGFDVAFDPVDPNLVYTTSQGGALVRTRLDNNLRRFIRPAPREGEARLRFNWNAPFLISKHDPSVLYQGGNILFKLVERGDRWFAISNDLTRNEPGRTDVVGSDAETYGTLTAIAESSFKQGFLWVGSDDGVVHVTEDEGKSWKDVTPEGIGTLYVSSVVASIHDEQVAYLSADGHRSDDIRPLAWKTADKGKSWIGIAGDLPADDVINELIEDPVNPNVLYAGTEFGLYITVNGGGNWVRLNGEKLPPVAVDDLVIHPRERDLVLGTHGRSAWVLDDASFLSQLTPELMAKPVALFSSMPGTPRQLAMRSYGAGHGLFRAQNPSPGTAITFWVADAAGEPFSVTIKDQNGQEIRKLSGVTRRGVNRVVWDLQADEKHRFDGPDQSWFSGQKEFVPAGEYTAALKVGDESDETIVEVLPGAEW
jgi:photosystem II stability/assembly factor-like uncharacterized protein